MAPGTLTEKRSNSPLPNLGMYEVPGHGAITNTDQRRYLRSKENYDEAIKEIAEKQKTHKGLQPFEIMNKIEYAPEEQRAGLIREGLANPNHEAQRISAYMIEYVPEDQRAPLREQVAQMVESGFASSNLETQKNSAYMISHSLEDKRGHLVRVGLASSDPEVQRISAYMIRNVPEDQQRPLREEVSRLVRVGLTSPDPQVQQYSADMIRDVPDDQQKPFREQVDRLVKAGLASSDLGIQKFSASLIRYASEDQKETLIKAGLASSDPEIQKNSVYMIEFAPENKRASLRDSVINAGLGKYLVRAPLYKKTDVNNDMFSRAKFDKTGSELTLLGGGLKDKTVMRRITAEAFLAWQKLYEDSELWRRHGFEYVPIEPIQSFVLNKDGTVSVYCGVLDINLNSWKRASTLFKDNLNIQREQISNVIKEQNIFHGHSHGNNFCLRFYRDAEGQPDFTREPRLYLIDFDQAVS